MLLLAGWTGQPQCVHQQGQTLPSLRGMRAAANGKGRVEGTFTRDRWGDNLHRLPARTPSCAPASTARFPGLSRPGPACPGPACPGLARPGSAPLRSCGHFQGSAKMGKTAGNTVTAGRANWCKDQFDWDTMISEAARLKGNLTI